MARYNVPSIPVVDQDGQLLGRVTFDDVIDVVEAETTEDMLRFGGVSADEDLRRAWNAAVQTRLPWLFVNLLTAFVAGAVVLSRQDVIAAHRAAHRVDADHRGHGRQRRHPGARGDGARPRLGVIPRDHALPASSRRR